MSNDHDDSLPSPRGSEKPCALPSDPPDTIVTAAPSDIVEAMNAAFLQEQIACPAPLPALPTIAPQVSVPLAPQRSAPRPISPPRSDPVALALTHSAASLTPLGAPLTPRAPYASISDFRGGDEDVDPVAQTQAQQLPAEAKAILDETQADELETLASASRLGAQARRPRGARQPPEPPARSPFAQPMRQAPPSTPRHAPTSRASTTRALLLVGIGVGAGLIVLVLMGGALFLYLRVLHPR